ncbi:MAG: hypothetical protein QME70_08050 [Bacillota bacterium]|nr:hypothetical protein [Bacillota bacterium]
MPDLPGKSKGNQGLWRRLLGGGGSCCCGVRIVEEPEEAPKEQKDSGAGRAGQADDPKEKDS